MRSLTRRRPPRMTHQQPPPLTSSASPLRSALLSGEPRAIQRIVGGVVPLRPSQLVARPWGGDHLARLTGLTPPSAQRVGEAFLVAAWPDDPEARRYPSLALLPDGGVLPLPDLLTAAGPALLGTSHWERFGPTWPLLPKLLDVGDLLSVQAHPPGQPEVYLVLEAERGATIALGFRDDLDRQALEAELGQARAIQDQLALALAPHAEEQALEPVLAPWLALAHAPVQDLLPGLLPLLVPGQDIAALSARLERMRATHLRLLAALNHLPVAPGQVIFNRQLAVPPAGQLPSADVHALGNTAGRGVLLLEIRLPGGTLRAWDHARFPRRRLDLAAALAALPLRSVPAGFFEVERRPTRPGVSRSVSCALFALDHLTPSIGRDLALPALPGASTLHALRGQAQLYARDGRLLARLVPGDTLLVPAGVATTMAALAPATEILHVTLPTHRDARADDASHDPTPGIAQLEPPAPVELAFGTSGLRGLVSDMTDREVAINSAGFVRFLESQGELPAGAPVAIGEDLRARCSATGLDSSPRIARAVAQACAEAGHPVIHCGQLPTPALAYWASLDQPEQGKRPMPAIMITGSHIPSDRNGVKFYKLRGEVLKSDEPAILAAVKGERQRQAALSLGASPFDQAGTYRTPPPGLPTTPAAKQAYLQRYLAVFGQGRPLAGRRLVFFEHSAVGRDLIVELLEALGAEVIRTGRTDGFVAIDTEDLGAEALEPFRALVREHRPFALISTDGDSDRPLLIDEQGNFHRGDLLGLVTALELGARSVAVPVSTNDAVDRHLAALAAAGKPPIALTKTRIGSPWVIAAMQQAHRQGHSAVVGWEANGGFLLGSDITLAGATLKALPTRDAVLPLLAVLVGAARRGQAVSQLFAALPQRCATAALIDGVPPASSAAVLASLMPGGAPDPAAITAAFAPIPGLGPVAWIEPMDGLRIGFDSGEVLHLRPSGNAPQLRCYAVADSRQRADLLLARTLLDPDSVVRCLLAQIDLHTTS